MVGPSLDAIAGWTSNSSFADFDLRSSLWFLGANPRGRQSLADLSRNGATAGRVRGADEFHSRRTAAHHGTSVLRVVGVSDHWILRADFTLWHAAGFHVLRGLSPPTRDWSDPRLGAFALPF